MPGIDSDSAVIEIQDKWPPQSIKINNGSYPIIPTNLLHKKTDRNDQAQIAVFAEGKTRVYLTGFYCHCAVRNPDPPDSDTSFRGYDESGHSK